MKPLLTLFSMLLSTTCFAQSQLVFPIHEHETFNWRSIEHKPIRSIVDKFIRETPKEFEAFKPPMAYSNNLDSLRNHLHFLDINADGKDDILFEGTTGGEADEVTLFLNTGSQYKKIFSCLQGVVKMEWQDKRLSKLYIDNWGCCDDHQYFHFIYQATYNQAGIPSFKMIFQGLSLFRGTYADTTLSSPFRIEVLNDGYKIRSAPQIDDTSWQSYQDHSPKEISKGNTIGLLAKGATATVLGKRTDRTGREWYYVQLDASSFPAKHVFYLTDKFPTHLFGWISGRFVKTLPDVLTP